MENEILLNPKMKPRTEMPNIGVQDFIDTMDFFGFEVQIKLIPKKIFREVLIGESYQKNER